MIKLMENENTIQLGLKNVDMASKMVGSDIALLTLKDINQNKTIVLSFNNQYSIDAVIEELEHLRRRFNGGI